MITVGNLIKAFYAMKVSMEQDVYIETDEVRLHIDSIKEDANGIYLYAKSKEE